MSKIDIRNKVKISHIWI